MVAKTIGVLHPGAMGVTVGKSIRAGGHRVIWTSKGRSTATENRASEAGLENVETLSALVQESDIIISVCPPHAALGMAQEVVNRGFAKFYVDVNAVSPATSRSIMQIIKAAGAQYVDGGIIGPPTLKANRTRLYLSGESAGDVKVFLSRATYRQSPLEKNPDRLRL